MNPALKKWTVEHNKLDYRWDKYCTEAWDSRASTSIVEERSLNNQAGIGNKLSVIAEEDAS
jgi:hypothetical protein